MITSKDNKVIKDLIKLNKSASTRRKEGHFLVEGLRMLTEIPTENIEKIFVTKDFADKNAALLSSYDYEPVSDSIMASLTETKTPQGITVLTKMLDYSLDSILTKATSLLLLENLQDPGNLGTILRMSEGAGIDGIIMSKDTVDIYNPKVIRATMGSAFRVPFYYTDDLDDFRETIKELQSQGFKVYASHLKGENLYEKTFAPKTAILIGNEGNGLTDETTAMADETLFIPMKGKVESLNAAMAATVISYELMRQRM